MVVFGLFEKLNIQMKDQSNLIVLNQEIEVFRGRKGQNDSSSNIT